jgi:hypothetical protein
MNQIQHHISNNIQLYDVYNRAKYVGEREKGVTVYICSYSAASSLCNVNSGMMWGTLCDRESVCPSNFNNDQTSFFTVPPFIKGHS